MEPFPFSSIGLHSTFVSGSPLPFVPHSVPCVAELAVDELGLVAFLREREERLRGRRGPRRCFTGEGRGPAGAWSPRRG